MKKNFKLFLLFILFIPCVIKADMGSPSVRPYKMVVINPNGLDCYDYNNVLVSHLNKDDTFTVVYQFGEKYSISLANDKTCNLNSLDGAVLVTDILNPKNAINEYIENSGVSIQKVTSNNEALVYADEGVDVRKGPAEIYEVVDHLDKGVKFKYSYYINGGGITHVYIDDGDTVGWVELFGSSWNSKVLIQSSDKYIVKKDINLDCGTISRNTILSPRFKTDAWSRGVLVEHNECSKLLHRAEDIVFLNQINYGKYVSEVDAIVYEYYDNGGKELTRIPANTEFVILADASIQGGLTQDFYLSYNGKKGWIKVDYLKISRIFDDESNNGNSIEVPDNNIDNQEKNEVIGD